MQKDNKELINIIGNLNNEIYELRNGSNLVSPMSKSSIDFLETERNAMNEAYESEISILKQEMLNEKNEFQKIINQLNFQKEELQNQLNEANNEMNKIINTNNNKTNNDNETDLKLKIDGLMEQLVMCKNEIQNQQHNFEKERLLFSEELKKKNAEHEKKFDFSQNNKVYLDEIKKLKNQLTIIQRNNEDANQMLQNEIIKNSQLEKSLKQKYDEISNQMLREQEQNSNYKTIFLTLQSYFNTNNFQDIISKLKVLFSERSEYLKAKSNFDQIQRLLHSEIEKNNQLNLKLHAMIPPNSNDEAEMANKFANMQQELNHLNGNRINDLESTIIELQRQNEKLAQQIKEKDEFIQQQKHVVELVQSEMEVFDKSGSNSIILNKDNVNEDEKRNLLLKIDDLQKEIKNLQTENQILQNESQNILQEKDNFQNIINNLQTENDTIKKEITNLQNENDMLHEKIRENPNSQEKIKNFDNNYNNELNLIRERIATMADNIDKINAEDHTQVSDHIVYMLRNIEENNFYDDLNKTINVIISENHEANLSKEQVVKSYDQMNLFLNKLKEIYDAIEDFNCLVDLLYDKKDNLEVLLLPDIERDINMSFGMKRSPMSNSPFRSLLDSPKIIRNTNSIQRSSNSNMNSVSSISVNQENADVVKLPKKTSRIPLSVRQNGIDQKNDIKRSRIPHFSEPKIKQF